MMFDRCTPDARAVIVRAQDHARRLRHRYVGCEHLLLAIAASGHPAGSVLRERGIIPERVEEEIVRRVGLGGGVGMFDDLDRDALSAIGIDLDAVLARIEATFGPEALTQAAGVIHRKSRGSRLNPQRAVPPGVLRRWRRRWHRPVRAGWAPISMPSRRYQAADAVSRSHPPMTTRANRALQSAVRDADGMPDRQVGVEHLAVGVVTTNGGLVPPILFALGSYGPELRRAILDRYRKPG